MKANKIIKPSKYFRMSHNESDETFSLHISEAFPEDEGTYQCVAENPSGKVTSEASLKVTPPAAESGKHTALTPMKDVVCQEGQSAQFSTTVSGNPTPNIQWFREGTLIPQSADFQMYLQGNKAILQIKVTYPEDSGRFTCRATNSVGQAETSAMLTAHSKP
jgi:hypothetical protein